MQRSQPCTCRVQPFSSTAPGGGRREEAGGAGRASGEKDAKGKRRKRRRWGAELVLLQGLGGEGRLPTRSPEHGRASEPSGWGGSGRSPVAREAKLRRGSVQKQALEL